MGAIMNIMTVDLESWVHRPIFKIPCEKQTKDHDDGHLPKSINRILHLFEKYDTHSTFFVLGSVAEWYPGLIEEIYSKGHEIGVHGYSHTPVGDHTEDSFDEEISHAVEVLTSLSERPISFRSPLFSGSEFMYKILKKHGFKYDSSIFPIRTPLYDGSKYSTMPFRISGDITELPISVFKFSKLRIPTGGFYLRLFGQLSNKLLLNRLEKDGYIMFYFHPWEIQSIPKVDLVLHRKLFAYYKIPMLSKVEGIIKNFKFDNIKRSRDKLDELAEPTQ